MDRCSTNVAQPSGPYEIVCRNTDPDWLKHRATMVTASDVAAILGLSRFANREQVAAAKIAGAPTEDLSTNRYIWWGIEMEQPNLRAFGKLTGASVRPSGLLLRSKSTPVLGATLDGLVRPTRRLKSSLLWATSGKWQGQFLDDLSKHIGETGVLELKNVSEYSKGMWSGVEPPEEYSVQVRQQMYVSGMPYGVLVAKVGAADMRAFIIERDDFYFDSMKQELLSFWHNEVGR